MIKLCHHSFNCIGSSSPERVTVREALERSEVTSTVSKLTEHLIRDRAGGPKDGAKAHLGQVCSGLSSPLDAFS